METREIKVLDHGFVKIIDVMGSDRRIVDAARTSYEGAKTISDDRTLLRHLVRDSHGVPIEHCYVTFQMQLPIFVARQLQKYRISSTSEISGRYVELPELYYTPTEEVVTKQSKSNKQGGSQEPVDPPKGTDWPTMFRLGQEAASNDYSLFLESGMRRELARINLPLSTYTRWYWTVNLRSLFNVMEQRLHETTQLETREYAKAIQQLLTPLFPMTMEAFNDYILEAETLTKLDIDALKVLLNRVIIMNKKFLFEEVDRVAETFTNKTERRAFVRKINKLVG